MSAWDSVSTSLVGAETLNEMSGIIGERLVIQRFWCIATRVKMSDWFSLIEPSRLLVGGESVVSLVCWCYGVTVTELESMPCPV